MSTTALSGDAVLQDVYDPINHSLKTDIVANISGAQEVIISAADDNIAIRNTNNNNELLINPDGSINTSGSSTVTGTVNSNINGLTNFQTSQYSVGTSAVQLTPTPLTSRSSMSIKVITVSGAIVYVGNSSGVTTSTGYPLFNGDSVQLDLTPAHVIYAISSASGQTVSVLEIGN